MQRCGRIWARIGHDQAFRANLTLVGLYQRAAAASTGTRAEGRNLLAEEGSPWLSRLMARLQFPMPAAGQLRQLAQAAAQNASDLAADARLLLDAGRFPRAHALATLALEELGKPELCHAVLAGELDAKGFREEWSNHLWKLDRSRILAILSAPTEARVFATADDDCATKFRGLYVDVNASDPSGPPRTPYSEVTPALAREIVETAEEATRPTSNTLRLLDRKV